MLNRLPVSSRPDFTPLPSDPHALTPEQSAALWGGDVDGVLRRIVRGAVSERLATSHTAHSTLSPAPQLERVSDGR